MMGEVLGRDEYTRIESLSAMPIRVFQLSKELGVTSKDVIAEASNHGIELQNHMASMSEAEANLIRAFLDVPVSRPIPEPPRQPEYRILPTIVPRRVTPRNSALSASNSDRPTPLVDSSDVVVSASVGADSPPNTTTEIPREDVAANPLESSEPPKADLVSASVDEVPVAPGTLNDTLPTIHAAPMAEHGTERSEVEKIAALEQRVVRLEEQLKERSQYPTRFLERMQSAQTAIDAAAALAAKSWAPSLKSQELVRRLKASGFYLHVDRASDLLGQIASKRLVILQGPPGSGKSELAKLIASILLEVPVEQASTTLQIERSSEYEDLFADIDYDAPHFGPKIGPALNAIFDSIKSGDRHWLILDEINRGNANDIFTPLLAGLAATPAYIDHPNLFPNKETSRARIYLPARFRIIGTMNTFDEELYRFNAALERRCGRVDLGGLSLEQERELLLSAVDARAIDAAMAADICDRIVTTTARIRALATRTPIREFRYCNLGSAYALAAYQNAVAVALAIGAGEATKIPSIADQAVATAVLPALADTTSIVLAAVLSDALIDADMPRSAEYARHLIKQLEVI